VEQAVHRLLARLRQHRTATSLLGSFEVFVSRFNNDVPSEAPPVAPSACPFCQSAKISTPSEKVDASTYWRCDACGQMWNIARLRTTPRPPPGRRWNNGY
jgi:formate dehydrogenase maturation protein FdhE